MSAIRLRPDELELVARMIDKRDSAYLSGHTNDPFRVGTPNGGEWVLQYPGQMGAETIPSRTIERLGELNLLEGVREGKGAMTFHLADDIRDQLEELKDAAGQPSELARERDARARAEDRQSRLEVKIERDTRARAESREAFAARVGRMTNALVSIVFIGCYAAAVILPLILTTLAIGVVVSALVLLVFGILSWRFHIDAFRGARATERWAERRVNQWLASFEAKDRTR